MCCDGRLALNFLRPFIPVVGTEFPGGEIVLYIAVHRIPFAGLVAFFQGQVAFELVDDA